MTTMDEYSALAPMPSFRIKLRIKEKKTRRTWECYPQFNLCFSTGYRLINCGRSGYGEYNSDGEAVLDSWIDQPFYSILS